MCLSLLLFVGVGGLGGVVLQTRAQETPKLSPAPAIRNLAIVEFEKLRVQSNHVVLDVRTRREYVGGHVPGSFLLDANDKEFSNRVAGLDKSKTYLVHCAAGVRSDKAVRIMDSIGFTNLMHLPAGYRGWDKAGNEGVKGDPPALDVLQAPKPETPGER